MTPLDDLAVRRLQQAASWPDFGDGRYEALDEIGRGGMGTVFLARDAAFGREVAIKISNALDLPALDARLRIEAQVLAGLEHPGIVPIHDVGRLTDGRVFYVMKYVRGQLLLDHLAPDAGVHERLRIFERLCEPVAFAHAHGVVHRDLKPDNVMVGPFGEVLVMDWGVAKVASAVAAPAPASMAACPGDGPPVGTTEPGTVVGTRGYMAPEQASGDVAHTDHRADIYGLGGLLFTLLTREVPSGDPAALRQSIERDRRIPKPLRAVCLKALAPMPSDRYPDVDALASDVAAFRSGDPVGAARESWVDCGWRIASKYRAAILLVLAYLVMRAAVAYFLGR